MSTSEGRVDDAPDFALRVNAPFSFEDSLRNAIANERLADPDAGPTDSMDQEARHLAYDIFFGTSPLSSPSPSPPPSRPQSPHIPYLRPATIMAPAFLPSKSPAMQASRPTPQDRISEGGTVHPGKRKRSSLEEPHEPQAGGAMHPGKRKKPSAEVPHNTQAAKPMNSKARQDKKKSHIRRKAARKIIRAQDPDAGRTPRATSVAKHVVPVEALKTDFDTAKIPTASTGFIALRDVPSRVYTLKELVEERGFKLIRWDGKTSQPIVDKDGRVVAVLAGHPDDDRWAQVHASAFESIQASSRRCKFPPDALEGRRGEFPALNVGISFGGGQAVPGNLCHNKANTKELKRLLSDDSFKRIAAFASGAFATWAPKLHTYYDQHLQALLNHYPNLRRNFKKSVWAGAAFNFGPKTVTAKHRDFGNLPFGLCAVTALGNFDPTEGGHMVFWELGLVVEFPPGSTILLPSAVVAHSNTPIAEHETRCSFAQYSAGGVFRWSEDGFQARGALTAGLSKAQKKELHIQNEARCKLGLTLFSTLSEVCSL